MDICNPQTGKTAREEAIETQEINFEGDTQPIDLEEETKEAKAAPEAWIRQPKSLSSEAALARIDPTVYEVYSNYIQYPKSVKISWEQLQKLSERIVVILEESAAKPLVEKLILTYISVNNAEA